MKHLPAELQYPPFDADQVAWLQRWMDYWRTRARVLIAVCMVFILVLVAGLAVVVIEKEQLRDALRRDLAVAAVCQAEDSAKGLVAASFQGRKPTVEEKARAEAYIKDARARAISRVQSFLQGDPAPVCAPPPVPPKP